jgi:hypothetical protein
VYLPLPTMGSIISPFPFSVVVEACTQHPL